MFSIARFYNTINITESLFKTLDQSFEELDMYLQPHLGFQFYKLVPEGQHLVMRDEGSLELNQRYNQYKKFINEHSAQLNWIYNGEEEGVGLTLQLSKEKGVNFELSYETKGRFTKPKISDKVIKAVDFLEAKKITISLGYNQQPIIIEENGILLKDEPMPPMFN